MSTPSMPSPDKAPSQPKSSRTFCTACPLQLKASSLRSSYLRSSTTCSQSSCKSVLALQDVVYQTVTHRFCSIIHEVSSRHRCRATVPAPCLWVHPANWHGNAQAEGSYTHHTCLKPHRSLWQVSLRTYCAAMSGLLVVSGSACLCTACC